MAPAFGVCLLAHIVGTHAACFGTLIHHSGVSGIVGLVAPTGSGFQAATVENRDIPATVTDQFAILQLSGRLGHPDPTHSQHGGQKFVRTMKCIRVRPVLRHQEASGETRFHDMKAGAGG